MLKGRRCKLVENKTSNFLNQLFEECEPTGPVENRFNLISHLKSTLPWKPGVLGRRENRKVERSVQRKQNSFHSQKMGFICSACPCGIMKNRYCHTALDCLVMETFKQPVKEKPVLSNTRLWLIFCICVGKSQSTYHWWNELPDYYQNTWFSLFVFHFECFKSVLASPSQSHAFLTLEQVPGAVWQSSFSDSGTLVLPSFTSPSCKWHLFRLLPRWTQASFQA